MRKSIFVLFIMLSSSCKVQDINITIQELLPDNNSIVDIMQLAASSRAEELSNLFKKSLQEHSEWTKEYVMKHRNLSPGEPLPYHPNFGMSEEEYVEMQKLLRSMTFKKVDQEIIVIKKEKDKFIITSGEKLGKLLNVEIDIDNKSIMTPFGTCKEFSIIKNLQGLNGNWDGFAWKLESGDPLHGNAVNISFDLGYMKELKKAFILYKAKKFKNGSLEDRADLMIYYKVYRTKQ